MMVLHLVDGARGSMTRRLDGPLPLDNPSFPFAMVVPYDRSAVVLDAEKRPIARLRVGDALRLGELQLRLTREVEPTATERVFAARIPGALCLRLDDARAVPLEGPRLLIGRGVGCDLTLDDLTVSAAHCELVPEEGRWRARDLGSTNGLRVNGAAVREAWLGAGATLGVGRVTLRVETRAEPAGDDALVGSCGPMRSLRADITRFAPAPYPVLIQGESGVGKELVARAVHTRSPRGRGAFVAVNCGALSPEVIESELFGHERGAFTGAVTRRRGLFEEAHGGTLFLDEIGELAPALQTRLLRVLETGEIRRVGGESPVRVDVRVLSATWRNLDAMVADGAFRQDLFYRLADLRVRVPSLRERTADIPALATALLARIQRETGRRCALEDRALARLMLHPWPGNVRELLSVLKRAVFLCEGDLIAVRHVELAAPGYGRGSDPYNLRDALGPGLRDDAEEGLRAMVAQFDGNLSRVSKATGLARSTVRARLARVGALGPRDSEADDRYDPER
jgi:DNA-binding NtrC family response regulator